MAAVAGGAVGRRTGVVEVAVGSASVGLGEGAWSSELMVVALKAARAWAGIENPNNKEIRTIMVSIESLIFFIGHPLTIYSSLHTIYEIISLLEGSIDAALYSSSLTILPSKR